LFRFLKPRKQQIWKFSFCNFFIPLKKKQAKMRNKTKSGQKIVFLALGIFGLYFLFYKPFSKNFFLPAFCFVLRVDFLPVFFFFFYTTGENEKRNKLKTLFFQISFKPKNSFEKILPSF